MSSSIKVTYHMWEHPSEIICCTKGIFVFVQIGKAEEKGIMERKVQKLIG